MTLGIAQSNGGISTRTMPGSITSGHILIALLGCRNSKASTFTLASQGYTQSPDGVATAFNNDGSTFWYKTAGGGESTTLTIGDSEVACWWAELDAAATFTGHAKAQDPHDASTTTTPGTAGVAASSGDLCIVVTTEGTDGGWGAQTYTPASGWTEDLDTRIVTDHPSVFVGHKVSAGATEVGAPTCTGSGYWSAHIATFVPSGGGSSGRAASIINMMRGRQWALGGGLWLPKEVAWT